MNGPGQREGNKDMEGDIPRNLPSFHCLYAYSLKIGIYRL